MLLARFWKICLFLVLFEYSSTVIIMPPQLKMKKKTLVAASAEVLENSLIFQKCAKCTLTLMSNYEIDF